MNQLSRIQIDPRVVDLSARRPAASNRRRLAAARADLRAASAGSLVRQWRRDPATGGLLCVWTVSQGGREPAAPVPLRRAS